MKKLTLLGVFALWLCTSTNSMAGPGVHFGISVGGPVYYAPAYPAYYGPGYYGPGYSYGPYYGYYGPRFHYYRGGYRHFYGGRRWH